MGETLKLFLRAGVLRILAWGFPVLVAVVPVAAHAQGACLPRDAMVSFLAETHQERPVAFGSRRDGSSILMLFVSEAGGWSAVIVTAAGMACMVDAGEGWSAPAPQPKGDPS